MVRRSSYPQEDQQQTCDDASNREAIRTQRSIVPACVAVRGISQKIGTIREAVRTEYKLSTGIVFAWLGSALS